MGTAREVDSEWSQMEALKERLWFFVEECDHIQVLSFLQQTINKHFVSIVSLVI
jgi:hypothetical protein